MWVDSGEVTDVYRVAKGGEVVTQSGFRRETAGW